VLDRTLRQPNPRKISVVKLNVYFLLCVWLAACAQPQKPNALPVLPAPPKLGTFDPATTKHISINDLPIVPLVDEPMRKHLQVVIEKGKKRGNNPRVFTELGDCMTENEQFLLPFASRAYRLGEYASLEKVIDRFIGIPARTKPSWVPDSFATVSLATAGGFNIAGPLDPTWSNPDWCEANESPMACEFRVSRPSVAVIMFGTNDVNATDAATYDFYLRTIVSNTLDMGVVPILSTFPHRPENPDKTLQLNQIAVKIAQDYNVPIMNLYRALEALPNRGVNVDDTTHLSTPPDGRTDIFDSAHLQYGFTVRNLVTLQTMQAVLQE
jgi:hypothetical protein